MSSVKPDKLSWIEQSINDKEPLMTVNFTRDKIEEICKNYAISYKCSREDISYKYGKHIISYDPDTKQPIYSGTHVELQFFIKQYKIDPKTQQPTAIPAGYKLICSYPQPVAPQTNTAPPKAPARKPQAQPKKDLRFGFYGRLYNDEPSDPK